MILGIHALLYTPQAAQVRSFFSDVLGFQSVDAGHGWLIFALPPAELGIHPSEAGSEGATAQELYLMCDNIDTTMADLSAKGVEFARPVTEAGFGRMTAITLPGGGELGLYEPRHPTALHLRT